MIPSKKYNLNPDRDLTIDSISKSLKIINKNIHLMNCHFDDFNQLNKPLTAKEFDSDCQQILKYLGFEEAAE